MNEPDHSLRLDNAGCVWLREGFDLCPLGPPRMNLIGQVPRSLRPKLLEILAQHQEAMMEAVRTEWLVGSKAGRSQ